jgi:hypothetical protein
MARNVRAALRLLPGGTLVVVPPELAAHRLVERGPLRREFHASEILPESIAPWQRVPERRPMGMGDGPRSARQHRVEDREQGRQEHARTDEEPSLLSLVLAEVPLQGVPAAVPAPALWVAVHPETAAAADPEDPGPDAPRRALRALLTKADAVDLGAGPAP